MSQNAKRVGLRFSLKDLFLLTAIVALSITVAMFWREVGPLRREMKQLRNEVGQLSIDDPTKTHIIAIATDPVQGYEWRWRVYVPPGAKYQFTTEQDSQSDTGFKTGSKGAAATLNEGEHTIKVILHPGEGEQWHLKTTTRNSNVGGSTALRTNAPGSRGMSTRSSSDASHESKAFDTKESILLLNTRVTQSFESPPKHKPYLDYRLTMEPL